MSPSVAFLGASVLGARCCEALIEAGVRVERIVSIPREFRISWSREPVENVQFADMSGLAASHGIPYMLVGSSSDQDAALVGTTADLLVVVGWYYRIPAAVRARARLGAVGLHASLLPRYRGGAPLVWALINGERETGVTLFHLADGIDDGDVVAQSPIPISRSDDIASLLERASQASVDLVRTHVPRVLHGSASRTPQDSARATIVPQRTPADGLIPWDELTAERAYDWIRAQTSPYPGAFAVIDGRRVTVWNARPVAASGTPRAPGTLDPKVGIMWCALGTALELGDVSIDGGPRMPASAALQQLPLASGFRDQR